MDTAWEDFMLDSRDITTIRSLNPDKSVMPPLSCLPGLVSQSNLFFNKAKIFEYYRS